MAPAAFAKSRAADKTVLARYFFIPRIQMTVLQSIKTVWIMPQNTTSQDKEDIFMFPGSCRISDEVKILHLPHAELGNAGRADAGATASRLSGGIAAHLISQTQYNAFN